MAPKRAPSPAKRVSSPRKARASSAAGDQSPGKRLPNAAVKPPVGTRGMSPAKRASTSSSTSKPSSRSSSTSEQSFLSRFQEENEYGQLLRELETEAYEAQLAGHRRPSAPKPSKDEGFDQDSAAVQKHNFERAIQRGSLRAANERNLRSIDGGEQDIPYVDHDSVMRDIPGSSRSGTPRKASARMAVTPEQPNKTKGKSSKKRVATQEHDYESQPEQSPTKRGRGRPRKESQPVTSQAAVKKEEKAVAAGVATGPGRGTLSSAINGRYIPETGENGESGKPNPFYESMPAAEVWHRRMAPYFPFGETPFMERVMSNQINEDLARSHEENMAAAQKSKGMWDKAKAYLPNVFTGKEKQKEESTAVTNAKKYTASPWELPEVASEHVEAFREGAAPSGTKRKASVASAGSTRSGKRAKK